MKKTTLQDFRDILVNSPEASDRHIWGVVTRQNKNAQGKVTSYEVALGGDEGSMTCRKLAGADVGDTVMVTLTKKGSAIVTGTVDGDKDAENALTAATEAQQIVDDLEDLVGDGDESGITVKTQYYLSTSNTTPTGGSWQDTLPTYVDGRYYWTKTVTTYADGSEVESDPILDIASQLTAEVNSVVTAENQHFWHDSTGAYVTKADKSLTSGYAMKITSQGLLQTYNGNNLMALTSSGLTFYQDDGRTPLATYTSSGATIYSGGAKRVTFGDMTSFYDDTGTHEIGRFTTTYTSGYSTFYIQSFINTYNYGAIELRSDSGDSYDRVVLTASTGTSSNTYQGSFNVAPKLIGCNLFNGAGGSSPVTGFALTPTEFQVSDGYSKTFSVTTSTGNVYCGNISASSISTAATVFTSANHSFDIPAITTSGGSTGAKQSSFSKAGYYPVAIAGFQSGGSNLVFVRMELTSRSSGSATITYNARAIGTTTPQTSASVNILWVKTS